MMTPTVHLNGTSKEELYRNLDDAVTAIFHALTAIHNTGPNGRDYYPQGPDALSKAQAEHDFRINRMHEVRRKLYEMMETITDAEEAPKC